jgi:hypothetical protein
MSDGSGARGWLLTAYESAANLQHRAVLLGWVRCGERSDYAWVDLDPPLKPAETGISMPLTRVVIAPRHEGVYLDQTEAQWPIHVYLLTTAAELLDHAEVAPDSFKIQAWGLLNGTI